MRALDRAARFGLIANGLTAAVALWFLVRSVDGTQTGPARTDDLPYGDLLTLNRTGAAIWLVVALLGCAAAVTAIRPLRLASAGLWAVLAVVGFVVVAADSGFLGMGRPGVISVSLGLALTGVVTSLPVVTGPAPRPARRPTAT